MAKIFAEKRSNSEQSVYQYQDLTVCNFEQSFTYGFDQSFSPNQEIVYLSKKMEYLEDKCNKVDELFVNHLASLNTIK